MGQQLGVGFIGAGPVTQAIHLPTLATLSDRYRVVHVMDVDENVAGAVAARAGARASTQVHCLLEDAAVDVVAVCSPHQSHAEQIDAAARAGKRGVLCEKPLATTVQQAQHLADVAGSGMPIVVGAMQVYDPAVVSARDAWARLADEATLVRSVAYLPDNNDLVRLATELAASPATAAGGNRAAPQPEAARIRAGVLGLATHNLPLVRRLLPTVDDVLAAGFVPPFGYTLAFRSGDRLAHLLALMPGQWQPDWSFRAFGSHSELDLRFPPSYVLAGSATATWSTAGQQTTWRHADNGYQREWLHLADAVEGRIDPTASAETAVQDLLYALRLADGADALVRENR